MKKRINTVEYDLNEGLKLQYKRILSEICRVNIMIAPFYTRLYLIYLKWNVCIDNNKKEDKGGRLAEIRRFFMDDSWFICFMMIVGHFFTFTTIKFNNLTLT